MKLPNAAPKPRKSRKRAPKGLKRSRIRARGKRSKRSGGNLFPGYIDEAYRTWIRGRQCLIAGRAPRWVSLHNRCEGVTQAAHIRSRGAGGADHQNLLPLCVLHHHEQHEIGKLSFEARYTLSLRDEAASLWKRFVESELFRESVGGGSGDPNP